MPGAEMKKKTFISFAVLVVVLAALIPWLAFRSSGDAAKALPVPDRYAEGKHLFDINCGTCHTLYAAGTDGNYGPDLDEQLAPNGPVEPKEVEGLEERVLNAVENGVSGEAAGRMPAGIVNPEQAKEISEFVARVAGEG